MTCEQCKYHSYIDNTHFCDSRNHKRKTVRISQEDAKKDMECYWADKEQRRDNMSEVGIEIVKTEETKENDIKYLNINVSNDEVERNPDVVRLCSDIGILEYVKLKTGHWIGINKRGQQTNIDIEYHKCSNCGLKVGTVFDLSDDVDGGLFIAELERLHYCPNCYAKMESEKKE